MFDVRLLLVNNLSVHDQQICNELLILGTCGPIQFPNCFLDVVLFHPGTTIPNGTELFPDLVEDSLEQSKPTRQWCRRFQPTSK